MTRCALGTNAVWTFGASHTQAGGPGSAEVQERSGQVERAGKSKNTGKNKDPGKGKLLIGFFSEEKLEGAEAYDCLESFWQACSKSVLKHATMCRSRRIGGYVSQYKKLQFAEIHTSIKRKWKLGNEQVRECENAV